MGGRGLVEAQKSLTEDWSLWLLVGVALLMVGGYYLWSLYQPTKTRTSWIFDGVETEQVRTVTLKDNGDKLWTVRRTTAGWKIDHPPNIRPDSTAISKLVKRIVSLEPNDRFQGRSGESYGISTTKRYLLITLSNGTHRLYFGGNRPSASGRYVRYGTDNQNMFVLNNRDFKQLNQSLKDLRRTELFEIPIQSVQQFSLGTTGDSVTYNTTEDGWMVQKNSMTSELSDTTAETVRKNLQSFLTLTADQFYDTPPRSIDVPTARIEIITNRKTIIAELGPTKGNLRFLRRSRWPVVGVEADPAKTFQTLPRLPQNWPEPLKTNQKPIGQQPPLP